MTDAEMSAVLDLRRQRANIQASNRRLRQQMESAHDGTLVALELWLMRNQDDLARLRRQQAAIQAQADGSD